jgi:hypothetical protein
MLVLAADAPEPWATEEGLFKMEAINYTEKQSR